jgi:holo-[acyl-carrier protein] synthase
MIAVGTDILKIDRIDEVLDRLGDRFVQRILTPVEQEEYGQSAQAPVSVAA